MRDVTHIPWSQILSGIFILTSLNDTSSPRAREHLRSCLHLTHALSRKVLILTKPKGKIYKTKSLRNYITNKLRGITRVILKSSKTHLEGVREAKQFFITFQHSPPWHQCTYSYNTQAFQSHQRKRWHPNPQKFPPQYKWLHHCFQNDDHAGSIWV